MSQSYRNINPVAFLTDERQLSFRRAAAYGEKRPQPIPIGIIPPFQIYRDNVESAMLKITLYSRSTGGSVDITSAMNLTGLEVLDFGEYKLWAYPGTVPIPVQVSEGYWYMTIKDVAGNILTREDWCWKQQSAMTGMVKMEWFHQRNFPNFPRGYINFKAPFKFWSWFDTELGKPAYQYDRDVDTRNGVEYVNAVVSWKEQRFVTRGDENLIDALSFVPHMDCVNVFFLGDEINTFKVLVTPEWEERGDEALVEIEIRSNQVIATFGDALPDKEYAVLPLECIAVDFVAVTLISTRDPGYGGGYYTGEDGNNHGFQNGDYVLVKNFFDGLIRLFVFDSGSYNLVSIPQGTVIFDQDHTQYYVKYEGVYEVTKPVIISIDTTDPDLYVIEGFTYPGTVVQIFGRKQGEADSELLAVVTETQLSNGVQVFPNGNDQFMLVASTYKCEIGNSVWFSPNATPNGIGTMEVESNFIIA